MLKLDYSESSKVQASLRLYNVQVSPHILFPEIRSLRHESFAALHRCFDIQVLTDYIPFRRERFGLTMHRSPDLSHMHSPPHAAPHAAHEVLSCVPQSNLWQYSVRKFLT